MRVFLAQHLYSYLAGVVALVVGLGIVFARDELLAAVRAFDPRWIVPVLGLTLLNYGLRFAKWHRLLGDSGIRVPVVANAWLYFACFTMVVTPARLGELYKLVFLRRLHGIATRRALPALVIERVTDGLAVLALASIQPFAGPTRVLALVGSVLIFLGFGAAAAHPGLRPVWRRWLPRLPIVGKRAETIDELLTHHAALLAPSSLGPSLSLSVLAWGSECVGLYLILVGLDAALGLGDATWIYAWSTAVGNLTFLPGGLGSTEVSLAGLLKGRGIGLETALGATMLVRAATLWFAVALGLSVSFLGRRRLQWDAVRAQTATGEVGEETAEAPRDYS